MRASSPPAGTGVADHLPAHLAVAPSVRHRRAPVCRGLTLALALTVSTGCGAVDREPPAAGPDAAPTLVSTGPATPEPTGRGTTGRRSAAGTPAAPTAGDVAAPATLRIAALGLEEDLVDLGLAEDGSMEVPADPARAGWFTGGGRPGGFGPTILAGHVDSDTGPAVFFPLTQLRPGDLVEVERADGVSVVYEVTEVADYAKGDFPTAQVFGATREDTLRLITCTGPWDSLAQSYEDNHVVYATAADA